MDVFPASIATDSECDHQFIRSEDLAHRRGVSSILVPNVLDFETEPEPADEYTRNFRKDIGLSDEDILFLQPTRVVPGRALSMR